MPLFIQSADVMFCIDRLCVPEAFLGAKALMDDGKRHLQNGEGPSLTAERLLALFSDSARRRSITRDIDPASLEGAGPPQSRSAADRNAEIQRASTTMLLVAMALALRDEDPTIGALLRSEDPDVRLASAFYLGDSARRDSDAFDAGADRVLSKGTPSPTDGDGD
jgi:hypothetical protein